MPILDYLVIIFYIFHKHLYWRWSSSLLRKWRQYGRRRNNKMNVQCRQDILTHICDVIMENWLILANKKLVLKSWLFDLHRIQLIKVIYISYRDSQHLTLQARIRMKYLWIILWDFLHSIPNVNIQNTVNEIGLKIITINVPKTRRLQIRYEGFRFFQHIAIWSIV